MSHIVNECPLLVVCKDFILWMMMMQLTGWTEWQWKHLENNTMFMNIILLHPITSLTCWISNIYWCNLLLSDAGSDDIMPLACTASLVFSFLAASADDLPWSSTALMPWLPDSAAFILSFVCFSFFAAAFDTAWCILHRSMHGDYTANNQQVTIVTGQLINIMQTSNKIKEW